MTHLSGEIATLMPVYSMQVFPNIAQAILMTIEHIFPSFLRSLVENSTPDASQV